ncbi:hypothetical protein V8C43DRAFT_33616 [Trichoderma afarasin]
MLLHLAVPVTRCCFSCRQSIGYAIKRPHHLRTMSRAISRTHQVFSAALGHASDALLTLFANQFNAQTAPVPGALWHPPAGIRPVMMMLMERVGSRIFCCFLNDFSCLLCCCLFASCTLAAAYRQWQESLHRSIIKTSGPPGIAKLGLRLSAGQVSCLASRRMYIYHQREPSRHEQAWAGKSQWPSYIPTVPPGAISQRLQLSNLFRPR